MITVGGISRAMAGIEGIIFKERKGTGCSIGCSLRRRGLEGKTEIIKRRDGSGKSSSA